MGHNISSMARASTALDSYVAELGNDVSYDKSLSSSRFLKTILARHAYGPLVLKIFIKPDVNLSLRPIQQRLKRERDALADLPGANTYQTLVETEKAGYLIRQWVGSNLYDRVSTQPYLGNVEKKWIAFQLLTTLRDARTLKVAHGDIKSENVLITTDLTVQLTDFSSSFKPTYLPLDDPSDFSFFFDTSSRRTCYLAPERFFASDSSLAEEKRAAAAAHREASDTERASAWAKRDGKVTEGMDVFSAGCVLAEMWTDGRTVFNLSELFAYRDGSLGLDGLLDNIDDVHVKAMISQMLSRDPEDRPHFDRILTEFRGTIFPEYFYTFLKDYITSLSEATEPREDGNGFLQRSAGVAGTRIDRLLDEWESISVHLDGKGPDEDGPALLLLNVVTSSIRNCLWPSSRLHGLQLFLNLSPNLMDEDKVDRIVPFVVELLSDEVAIVRAEACRTLVTVVESVSSITPQNSTYIPEYLLPQMRHLSTDPDVFVRATYARGLVRLADAAVLMLEMSQAAKVPKSEIEASGIVEPDYDSMLLEIQSVVEEQATTLLVDQSSNVKRSMLSSISDLCLFFGRQKSNETVLSHIMTYLNDRDWLLRLAFFDGIVGVGAFIGIRAVEEYVLPLMLQALADPEEAVVARVVMALTSLASLGLLPRMRLWDVFFAVRGFLCHPNSFIRQGTAGFIAAAARNLPPSDVWCIFYPAVRIMLQSDVLELDEDSIMSVLIPPLSRSTLAAAKNLALANSPPGFWDVRPSSTSSKASLTKAASSSSKSSETYQLKDKGISPKDERKISALREFIVKQAHASRAREATEQPARPEAQLANGEQISLGDLGVTPQTVFISPRTIGMDAQANLRRLKPHLTTGTSSRRTSFASRSNRGAIDNPLDEIRKRLAPLEPHAGARPGDAVSSEPPIYAPGQSPSDSAISSSLDLAALPRSAKKRVEQKVAPAVAAVHTTALGTTTIHDEPASGRSTPTINGPATPRGPAAPYSSSYEGQDPGVRAFLEQVDLENYREPLLDFGPKVVANQRKHPSRGKSSSSGVTMIAHLAEHTGTITSIVTSPDQVFFATASEDRSILIWDTARLERSVYSKPRLTYRLDAPVTAMCRIENQHCLAAAAEDGQLHLLRVHVVTPGASAKYGKVECLRTWQTPEPDGHITFVHHLQESTLLIVTSMSTIALLDLRTMEISTRFRHPLEHGVITAVNPDKHWLVLGTELGILSLWDLRFGLLLKSWRASGAINALSTHPSKGRGLWLIAGVERKVDDSPIIEVYNIETSKPVEVYEVRSTRPSAKSVPPPEAREGIPDKAGLIAEIASGESAFSSSAETDRAPPSSVLSLAVGQRLASMTSKEEEGGLLTSVPESKSVSHANPGYMITAGEDRVVRYWDLAKPGEGMVICGSPKEKDVVFKQAPSSTTPALFYTLPTSHRQSMDKNVSALRQPLRPHYDAISAVATVETPFSSCVISADRSGVIKVWRMEGGGKA